MKKLKLIIVCLSIINLNYFANTFAMANHCSQVGRVAPCKDVTELYSYSENSMCKCVTNYGWAYWQLIR